MSEDADSVISNLAQALRGMLEDYRSEGCSDPRCNICRESKAAEKAAREAIKQAEAYLGAL